MLRSVILAAAGNRWVKRLVDTPLGRSVARRYIAGEDLDDAMRVTAQLTAASLSVTLDHLGEDTTDVERAAATVKTYTALLERLGDEGMVAGAEVSLKLSAVGQALDERLALDHARQVCAAAARVGTTVTLDMEDHTTTDSTLGILRELRQDFPDTGVAVQAYLRRTEADCRDLAHAGSRVRLCKGAYREPASVAYQARHEVDRSYVRCLNVLMAGDGYPMVATHDPTLVAIAGERARWYGRRPGGYEYQMLHGVRPDEQRRLAAAGEKVRVYLAFGTEWYGFLMRRLAERPANLVFFLRSLVSTR